eukprot:104360_1
MYKFLNLYIELDWQLVRQLDTWLLDIWLLVQMLFVVGYIVVGYIVVGYMVVGRDVIGADVGLSLHTGHIGQGVYDEDSLSSLSPYVTCTNTSSNNILIMMCR